MDDASDPRFATPAGGGADELVTDYRSAGFGVRLGAGTRPALLYVDFQQAYVLPNSPLYAGVEASIDPASRLLEAGRRARLPIVHTKVVYRNAGRDGGAFFRKARGLELFSREGPEAAFVPVLAPAGGEYVVEKQFASAFFGTALASMLCHEGVDMVIIAGWSTSGCVRATAVDAVQSGFIPWVVREAVGDRDPAPHHASLFDLDAKYADVVSEAVALEFLGAMGAAPRATSR